MEPATVLTEGRRHRVDERRDIVVRLALELRHALGRRRDRVSAWIRSTASAGMTPTLAHPSSAASSTSSIRASRASSDQIRAMSGRE